MKILLFGKNGQVGWELHRSLLPLSEVTALDREQADFSAPEAIRSIIRSESPDVIVNAVAYTAVDKAEAEESLAKQVNYEAPKVLAEEALELGALLVHYSTDYVFNGQNNLPYTEVDDTDPVNAYGRTKLGGENAIIASGCDYLIFRTSWVFASRGRNFLMTMFRLMQEREELGIVSDQIGAPTSSRLIADVTSHCIKQSMSYKSEGRFVSGLYHLTSAGSTSWYGFAEEIARVIGLAQNVSLAVKSINAVSTDDYPAVAIRPLNSRLDCSMIQSTFGLRLPPWQMALSLCLNDLLDS